MTKPIRAIWLRLIVVAIYFGVFGLLGWVIYALSILAEGQQ